MQIRLAGAATSGITIASRDVDPVPGATSPEWGAIDLVRSGDRVDERGRILIVLHQEQSTPGRVARLLASQARRRLADQNEGGN